MAARLASGGSGRRVLVRGRTAEKGDAHAAQHGTESLSSWESLRDVSAVLACLPTSAEVADVAEAALPHMSPGTLFVDCTSGCPDATLRIAARLQEGGVAMVDAPLSGGPAGAEAGRLSVIAGGAGGDVARCRDLLAPCAASFEHVGALSAAHAVKAVNNALATAALLSCCEGLGALRRRGVDPERALAAINASSGASWCTREIVPKRVLTGTLDHGFALRLMRKDVGIAASLAAGQRFAELCDAELAAAIDAAGGDADLSRAGARAHDAVAAPPGGFDWSGIRVSSIAGLGRPLIVARGAAGYLASAYVSTDAADELGEACAVVAGARTQEEMLGAEVVRVSAAAAALGVAAGATGADALRVFRGGAAAATARA